MINERCAANLAAELLKTRQHLSHVSSLEKIDCLEEACAWYSVRFTEIYKYLDVFHLKVNTTTIKTINFYLYKLTFNRMRNDLGTG